MTPSEQEEAIAEARRHSPVSDAEEQVAFALDQYDQMRALYQPIVVQADRYSKRAGIYYNQRVKAGLDASASRSEATYALEWFSRVVKWAEKIDKDARSAVQQARHQLEHTQILAAMSAERAEADSLRMQLNNARGQIDDAKFSTSSHH